MGEEEQDDHMKPLEESPIWLPEGAVNCEEAEPDEQLKVAIIGPSGGGKSYLAATAPKKPIWFWDVAGRLASVSGKKGVYGKTYLETTTPNQSTAWAELETDMQMFEYQKLSGKGVPGTMVFDDMDYLIERIDRKIISDNPDNPKFTRKTSANGRTYLAPQGWPTYNQESSMLQNFLARGVELKCDIIAIFHEREEEAADSTPEEKKFTGRMSVHPPRAENLLPLFNEKWRILPNWDGSMYEVFVKPNSEFIGKTCFKIDAKEEANITKIIEKHKQNLQKEKGNG